MKKRELIVILVGKIDCNDKLNGFYYIMYEMWQIGTISCGAPWDIIKMLKAPNATYLRKKKCTHQIRFFIKQ